MPGKIGDRIAVLKRELNISSNRGLEKGGLSGDEWIISNGLLSTWQDLDVDEFASNTLEKFLNHYRISRNWWKTGHGEVFITSAQKPTDNTEKMNKDMDLALHELIEKNDKYRLVPTIILDQYEILPKNEIVSREKILEKLLRQADEIGAAKQEVIDSKNMLIDNLKKEIAGLEYRLSAATSSKHTQ